MSEEVKHKIRYIVRDGRPILQELVEIEEIAEGDSTWHARGDVIGHHEEWRDVPTME